MLCILYLSKLAERAVKIRKKLPAALLWELSELRKSYIFPTNKNPPLANPSKSVLDSDIESL